MFDIPCAEHQEFRLRANLDIEDLDWSVGAIVGGSGKGKTQLARRAWPEHYVEPGGYSWNGACVLDDFPAEMAVNDVISQLTAVGFSSTPAWLRPFSALSTGQRHRAEVARALCDPFAVVDEFTSTVDRTVAKALCVAVSRHVRRAEQRFVAVTCHRDVLDWLEPDWVYDIDEGTLTKERLWRRPPIPLIVRPGNRSAWRMFRGHHYLSAELSPSARVFLASVTLDGDERVAGFFSILPSMGHAGWWRGHRNVVLPDYQGLGIGNAMIEVTAEALWSREAKRYRETTSAPGLIAHRRRHPEMWRLRAGPRNVRPVSATGRTSMVNSAGRLTTSWEYIPEALRTS